MSFFHDKIISFDCPRLVGENSFSSMKHRQISDFSARVSGAAPPSVFMQPAPWNTPRAPHESSPTWPPGLEIAAFSSWPSHAKGIAGSSTCFSSVFSLTGRRHQDAGDNEAGSWVSPEFLRRQPAESGSAPQTHKPVSKPRGKTGGLSGTLCREEDRGGWKQEERTACSLAVVATGTCYDATFIPTGNILIGSQEDVNTLWGKKVEGVRKRW